MPRYGSRRKGRMQSMPRFKRSYGSGWDRSRFAKRVRTIARSTQERKHLQYDLVTGAPHEVDWQGRLHHLSAVPSGSGVTNRVGSRITPQSLTWRFLFHRATNTDTPLSVTLMIFRDTQQSADNPPDVGSVVEHRSVIGSGLGLLSRLSMPRFRVLHRRTFVLHDVQSGTNAHMEEGYLKLPPANVGFNGTTATDVERNGLYCLMISDGDPALNEIFVTGNATFYYTDA